jgi:hypothetical protein
MTMTVRHRGAKSRRATGFVAATGHSLVRLRHMSARALLFSLLTFVLAFGAPIMRSAGIFEEDRSETRHQVVLTLVQPWYETDHRQRLPDFLPWRERGGLSCLSLRSHLALMGPVGHFRVCPPPSRASPGPSA